MIRVFSMGMIIALGVTMVALPVGMGLALSVVMGVLSVGMGLALSVGMGVLSVGMIIALGVTMIGCAMIVGMPFAHKWIGYGGFKYGHFRHLVRAGIN
jgi:hypothetical protein